MAIKKGDIILVHSHNWTAKLIQFGMNVERWLGFNFNPFWDKIYNHAAICVKDGIISEALSDGITVNFMGNAYKKGDNKDIIIFRPNWTKEELSTLYIEAIKYKGVKYQFINFLQYIPKILFGIWLGKTHKEAEDRLYCTEYVGLIINKISKDKYFNNYWRTSPNDIYKWCLKEARKITEYHI